jgi:ubiquinone/menaquinone biosynthesis C-methylase UbiE
LLASPLRRLMQDPAEVVAPYVRAGMTVLEPGPGMGFFTLELARRVGPGGRVIAVDMEPRMIEGLKRRAARAGVLERVDARVCTADSMGLDGAGGQIDFALACALVHEVPDAERFFSEVWRVLKPGACLLLAEPPFRIQEAEFRTEIEAAARAGFSLAGRPAVRGSRAALLKKR